MDPGYNDLQGEEQDAHTRSPRNFAPMRKSLPMSNEDEARSSFYHNDPNSWQELTNVAPKGQPDDLRETYKMSPKELRKYGVAK